MLTEPMGVPTNLPTLRDPDRLCYYKEEVGGLVMGGYEPNPIPWAVDGIPEGFHYTLLDSNFDHFEQIMEKSLGRVPALETAGIKTLTNGPESFHAGWQFHHRRGAGTQEFLRGRGVQRFRHRLGRRCGHGAGGMGA